MSRLCLETEFACLVSFFWQTLLRRQLSESEMRRNDCEMRLELAERKFRSRTGELTQYLEVSMCAVNT
jgi:hypothetical protein